MKTGFVLAAAAIAMATPIALSQEVVYSGSGVIDFADDGSGSFEVGQLFEFTLTIQLDELGPDSNPAGDGGVFPAPLGYEFQVVVPTAGFDENLGGNSIGTFNDAGSSSIDQVAFFGNSITIVLRDNDGSVFGSDAIPTTLPAIGAFEETSISYFPPGNLQNFGGFITEISVSSGNACAADFAPPGAPDGVLNFLDLGEFLNLFNASDPAADLFPQDAPDGTFNFLDLGEFLNLFGMGCP